jgi:hypothetical protein
LVGLVVPLKVEPAASTPYPLFIGVNADDIRVILVVPEGAADIIFPHQSSDT